MITLLRRRWLVAVMCCLPVWADAAIVPDLYAAAVPVPDRTEEARLVAYRAALAAVLVKVSGQRLIAGEPAAFDVLEQAPWLIQQYRYTDDGELWAGFDGRAVESAMRAAGLPVWGQDRPAVLLWLAVDWGGGGRGIVTATDDTELRRAIERVAASRGLPLVLPLFDSADRELMSFSDLWGGFTTKVRDASARYQADAVLVGRANRNAGSRLSVRWNLDLGGADEQWQGGLSDGIHRAADQIASRFAVRGATDSTQTLVAVSGIRSLDDYGRASAYLRSVSLVRDVGVQRVTGHMVLFALQLLGDPNQFVRIVDGGRVLVPNNGEPLPGGVEALQHYRLAP